MADFVITQGKTRPILVADLVDLNGDPLPLTGATVNFVMFNHLGIEIINAAATVTDFQAATVEYEFSEDDTAAYGTFYGKFNVTYSDLGKDSVPRNEEFMVIQITKEYADAA